MLNLIKKIYSSVFNCKTTSYISNFSKPPDNTLNYKLIYYTKCAEYNDTINYLTKFGYKKSDVVKK